MSVITKIPPYGRITDISKPYSDISLTEIALYGYICFMSGSKGYCYPSQNKISSVLNISCDALTRATRHLSKAGVISLAKRRKPNSKQWSYLYTLPARSSSSTYGRVTEKTISLCKDLSCGAIGLFFYLISAAGTQADFYITRTALSHRLNTSPKTLRKYIQELCALDLIGTYQERFQGCNITRFIVISCGNSAVGKNTSVTQATTNQIVYPCLTHISHDAMKQTKINREEYLSLDGCVTATEANMKDKTIRRELQDIYQYDNSANSIPDVRYDDVASQLQRFVRDGASRPEIMRVIKDDMRYLKSSIRQYPRAWISDPMIRSAALEVIFGVPKDDTTKTVISQLFWILGTAGDEQSRLLSHLDAIMSGKKNTQAWLSSLTNRAAKALKTRAILHPAAYVRRLILNWLSDRREQTVDLIDYHEEIDTTLNTASVPQTFEELVADTVCDRYRSQIRKLSRREYRDRANAYEAIVREREASGSPIERYDIGTDDEIVEIYAVMPESYYEVLHMIDVLDSEAILALPKQEIARRVFAYKRMSPLERASIFFDIETNWLLSPAIDDEAM